MEEGGQKNFSGNQLPLFPAPPPLPTVAIEEDEVARGEQGRGETSCGEE